MANIKSAKKRILVTETRTARNKAIKSEVKTMVKKVYAAIDSKDQEAAKAALKAAISTMDKATSKGVYHKNTTSRKISRMQKAINCQRRRTCECIPRNRPCPDESCCSYFFPVRSYKHSCCKNSCKKQQYIRKMILTGEKYGI